jgi:hypothetical protein
MLSRVTLAGLDALAREQRRLAVDTEERKRRKRRRRRRRIEGESAATDITTLTENKYKTFL